MILLDSDVMIDLGLLDVLIGQTAVALEVPLYTFKQKHYRFIPGLQTMGDRNDG